MCNDIVIFMIERDGRRLRLPNEPVVMEHDNYIEQRNRDLNTQPIFTYQLLCGLHVSAATDETAYSGFVWT